jgi:hypothetical protein
MRGKDEIANKLRRFPVKLIWNARRAGGLFIGIRLSFPSNVLFDDKSTRSSMQLSVGLLVITILMEFRGQAKRTAQHLFR